jgi:hypothetical protein
VLDPQQRSTLGDLIVAGDERLQEALDSFESKWGLLPLFACFSTRFFYYSAIISVSRGSFEKVAAK